mmetsp:Transcript_15441/g.29913  ORF Transcript_15441/g.29913 Transcript_15441/m.29913 type:complete len:231 (+) Transcript_15441:365-1057(+)
MTEMTTLFEFKAGMMNATENASHKFDVVADPRKGRVCLTRDQHGSAHVVWKLRPSGAVEEDLLVFPDNQTFSKVNTGRADDRVYLLQFNNSSRRFFFWMQGKKEDDPENCRKLNEYMSNPPAVPVGSLGGGGSGGGGNADQNAMMQLLSQFGGGGAGGAQLNESQLQSVLQGLGMGGAGSSRGNSSSSRSQRRRGSEGDDDDEEDNSGRSNRRNRDNDDDDEGKDDDFYN